MSSAPLQATDIIIDGIRDLLLMIDLRGTILLTNKRLQETLQYGEHNLLHYKFQNWLAEKNIIDEKIAAIRDHNIVTFQCMVHLIARDGRNIPVLLTGSVVKDSWDDVIGILLIGHDMTTLKQLQSEMLDRHSVEEALQDADYMLRSFADNFPGFILIKNQDSRIVMINKRMAAYYDFPQDHLVGMSTAELLPEAIAAQVMAREQQALQLEPGQALEVEEQLEWNGTLHSYSTSIFPIRRKNKITLVGSLSLDITDRKRAEQALRESEEKFRLLAETSVAAITIHRNGRFLYVNPKASELTGFSQSELLDMYIWEVFHPDFVETLHNIYRNFQPGMNLPSPLEAKTINREGKEIWNYIISCQIVLDGEPAVLSHFYDISDRKESEEQLQRLSMHDSITGLHNRTYFEEQMRRIEADQTAPVGIIICDVDGLKIVNDTLGHSTGDRLLVQAAHLIKKCFREDDIVARVGGDEFAVLLPHTPHKMVMNGYLRIRQAIVDYNSDNSDLLLKMSVGFAATDKPGAKTYRHFQEQV
jgi:diguanylate cyclase (GGDEF)-like protein/PAS domain S-box-containing protein